MTSNLLSSTRQEVAASVVMIKETVRISWQAGDSKVDWVFKKIPKSTLTTGDG